jgi:protocatechuate 3,4-dioxygenase beta subunit
MPVRHLIAAVLLSTAVSTARAAEATEVTAMVVDRDRRPIAGADVWLVLPGPNSVVTHAHLTTGADGRFTFSKELNGRLWETTTGVWPPSVVVRDRDGRLAGFRTPSPSLPEQLPAAVRLRNVAAVRGRIVDAAGRPIPGVRLLARSFHLPMPGQYVPEAIYLLAEIGDHYRAETAADGTFTLGGVPAGARMTADVEAAGFGRLTFDWDTQTSLELRLARANAVAGRLTGGTNADRGGRSLTLETADVPSRLGRRGSLVVSFTQTVISWPDGGFRFVAVPPGRYTLKPTESTITPLYLEDRPVEVKAGTDLTGLELPLKPARKVRGRVVDAKSGAGVTGVAVYLGRVREAGGPFRHLVVDRDSEARSSTDGWYEGYVVPAPRVGAQVGYNLPEGYIRCDAGEVVAEADAAAPLPPLRIEKAEPLVVRVVDPDGKPVAGATIQLTGAAPYLAGGSPRSTGADGQTRLALTDRGENVILRAVTSDAASEALVTINPAEVQGPITLTVSPANAFRLRGRVVDHKSRPLADARVEILRSHRFTSKRYPQMAGGGGTHCILRTDAEGYFVFGPAVPGDHYSARISADDRRPTGTAEVEAVKGKTHDFGPIVLAEMDAAVRGRVVDTAGRALAGARVINSGDAPKRLDTMADAAGRFELKGLTAGLVHLVAFAEGYHPARAADTDRPDGVTLTLRRLGEPDTAPPPEGIDEAAVRRAARQVLERLWEWPESHTSPAGQRVIDLMSRLDAAQARRWSGRPADGPSLDELATDDLDAALAQLAGRDADAACRELKRLAEKLQDRDRAKALRLATEMKVRARSVGPDIRPVYLADAGALLAQLGRADVGRKLIEEMAAQAETLSTEGMGGYVRGRVAARLAPFDLSRARKLIEAEPLKRDRDRYAAMCAVAVAPTNARAAAELLGSIAKLQRGAYTLTVAYRLAATDPEAAARLAEQYGEGDYCTPLGLAWAALAVARRDPSAAHRLIDRAFRAIHERRPEAVGSWGETAGSVALYALAVQYPHRGDLAAHVFAERPTDQDWLWTRRLLEAEVGLAVLLAPIDRAAARTLLEATEPRKAALGGDRRARYWKAWGLIDPTRATPLFLAEIDRLKANSKEFHKRCDLLDVLDVLTAPPADRLELLARQHGRGWPEGDIE